MTPREVADQLESIASLEDFGDRSADLTATWSASGAGVECVEPILRFVEAYPSLNFGAPGPLAHFAESFYGRGYEDELVESILRKPTTLTVWLLNRLINGTKEARAKQRLVTLMQEASASPFADHAASQMALRFLGLHRPPDRQFFICILPMIRMLRLLKLHMILK